MKKVWEVKKLGGAPAIPETWLGLQAKLCPLRPIHNKKDHNRAVKAASLLASQNILNKDQQDYLESLSLVIDSYEQKHFATDIGEVTPIEAISPCSKKM